MKDSPINVRIEEPCMQNWDEMETKDNFNFCTACSKNVIDFTGYTNAEIISVLASSGSSVCGRLTEMQLNQLNYYLIVKPANKNWMKYLGVLAIGASLFTQDAQAAKLKPETVFVDTINRNIVDNNPKSVTKLTGMVLDSNGTTVPGILVIVENTKYAATTDGNGCYTIYLKKAADLQGKILKVKSLRYSASTIIDLKHEKQAELRLKDEPMIMGKIAFTPR
ncbi:carboxypeptidase-like regulatory domain-containing protein [Pedobacter sandarakinus]|uniref:carboxypeptidase-like regulatory domain-containing protein n=1 Tax=Pedobacter sandarakinus TaxID=353156 RepID=UPI00224614DE|nr:carboxypeptidase-like regulatory domain-containing protein [Pedobacter sandarakinus]MCX2575462.1 carboxypeptidase-like regulatory domain-containing protein [Pedobacter sandarakinus]